MSTKKKNSKIVERITIPNTPFTATKTDNGLVLSMGKYRLTTNVFSDLKEIENYTGTLNWELLAVVCSILFESYTEIKATREKTTKI